MLWRHSTAAHTYDPDNLHSNLFERQLIFEGRAKYKLRATRKTCKVHGTRYNVQSRQLKSFLSANWFSEAELPHTGHFTRLTRWAVSMYHINSIFTRGSPSVNCTAWFCQIWKCSYLMVFPTNTKTSGFSLHVTHTLCSFLFSSPEASLGLKNPILWFFKSCGKCVLF